ncbi:unnamed protein product [Effrenium voratum]|nr:unnamed protein product [Effrenium voratum]CAJ1455911.1 unnamed protein product [Effrenium voratum]
MPCLLLLRAARRPGFALVTRAAWRPCSSWPGKEATPCSLSAPSRRGPGKSLTDTELPTRSLRPASTDSAGDPPAHSAPRASHDAHAERAPRSDQPMMADARVMLVAGALLCFGGSMYSVYVAVTHDPNRKEDRPMLKRGEYMAGGSVVGALVMMYLLMRR